MYEVRQLNGCLTRLPETFHADMWLILEKAPGGIKVGPTHLAQEPTLTQRTRYNSRNCPRLDSQICMS